MSRVSAPLFSLSAAGRLGRSLQYQRGKTGAIARASQPPSSFPSAAQTAQQSRYAAAAAAWGDPPFEGLARESWTNAAPLLGTRFNGYNAWLHVALTDTPDGVIEDPIKHFTFTSITATEVRWQILAVPNPNLRHVFECGLTPWARDKPTNFLSTSGGFDTWVAFSLDPQTTYWIGCDNGALHLGDYIQMGLLQVTTL